MSEIHWAEHNDPGAVADHLAGVIARPGVSRLAVPGGSTPIPILRCLGRRDLWRAQAEITLTDDRLVPHDHPASNFGLLQRSLDGASLQVEPLEPGTRPGRFDLVWIGMGNDGHVASIFPE
jgi:6-phosphogluconolactonase